MCAFQFIQISERHRTRHPSIDSLFVQPFCCLPVIKRIKMDFGCAPPAASYRGMDVVDGFVCGDESEGSEPLSYESVSEVK